jgi:hypothetical protein
LLKVSGLFRTFIFGLVLGFAGAGAYLYLVPVVDQHRVPSHVSVQTNGGNLEVFRIALPGDRIMTGESGSTSMVPSGLAWPESPALAHFAAELFKIRDIENIVVGVGSRMANSAGPDEAFVQWVLYLPARGTMFIAMERALQAGQPRSGVLSAGTLEFASLHGTVTETFVRGDEGDEAGEEGRIELRVALVGAPDDEQ